MSKIVWIINQYASTPETGMGGRHYYLARELAKQGHKVYLIGESAHHLLTKPPEVSGRFKLEDIDGFTYVWVRLPRYKDAHSLQRVINWFLFAWYVRRLYARIDGCPDAILCSSPSLLAFLGARSLARRFRSRLIFEVRDIWPLTLTEIGGYTHRNPFIRFMQWVEDKAYRDSDCVVSNLRDSIEHMIGRGLNKEKFRWIPNGFSMDEVSRKVELPSDVERKLPVGKFVVGYTGTLGVANTLQTLLHAAELLKGNDEIHFVIVGQGKEKAGLIAFVREHGLRNITFIDPIPKVQIQAMLARFNVCYIGLTKDPLFRFGVSPNKLFDYLYSGKPILYAIDSGNYKPVEEASAGFSVEPENPLALSQAILRLYKMPPDQLVQMGGNGRRAALEQYEYGVLARSMEMVLFGRLEPNARKCSV